MHFPILRKFLSTFLCRILINVHNGSNGEILGSFYRSLMISAFNRFLKCDYRRKARKRDFSSAKHCRKLSRRHRYPGTCKLILTPTDLTFGPFVPDSYKKVSLEIIYYVYHVFYIVSNKLVFRLMVTINISDFISLAGKINLYSCLYRKSSTICRSYARRLF